jgi:hypothetical protein
MLWAQITILCWYCIFGGIEVYKEIQKNDYAGAFGGVVGGLGALVVIYFAGGLSHIFGG